MTAVLYDLRLLSRLIGIGAMKIGFCGEILNSSFRIVNECQFECPDE
jgi:hypothetical protein